MRSPDVEPGSVRDRLVAEFGYRTELAADAADRLSRLEEPLRAAFLQWWTDSTLPDLEFSGYTVLRLHEEHGLVVPAAFLTLDAIRRRPEPVLAGFRRGVDRIRLQAPILEELRRRMGSP